MGVVGMTMSILFRLQLSNQESFPVLEFFLVKSGLGCSRPKYVLSTCNLCGTILVFWVLTAGLTGTLPTSLFHFRLAQEIWHQAL